MTALQQAIADLARRIAAAPAAEAALVRQLVNLTQVRTRRTDRDY